jgi:phage-related minor tail protein
MGVRGIGLSGRAQSFYESETAGVTDKDERERIRRQAAGIQFMEQAAGGTVKILEEVESGFADVFQGIIDGSDSAGEAFKNMANAILQAFTRMIAEMIASQLMSGTASLLGNLLSFLPIFAGAGASAGTTSTPLPTPGPGQMLAAAGGIMAYANGGVIKPRDGTEGVITRPTYLVGEGRYNEAVVPLPNGRAIPVQMHGGQGQNNNVTVNISMDGQGNSKEAPDLTSLGGLVAQAVQRELQEQKRPGGILNRYGAA